MSVEIDDQQKKELGELLSLLLDDPTFERRHKRITLKTVELAAEMVEGHENCLRGSILILASLECMASPRRDPLKWLRSCVPKILEGFAEDRRIKGGKHSNILCRTHMIARYRNPMLVTLI